MKQFIKLTARVMLSTRYVEQNCLIDPRPIFGIREGEDGYTKILNVGGEVCLEVKETPKEILALIAEAQGEVTVNLHDLAAGKYHAGTLHGDKNEVAYNPRHQSEASNAI